MMLDPLALRFRRAWQATLLLVLGLAPLCPAWAQSLPPGLQQSTLDAALDCAVDLHAGAVDPAWVDLDVVPGAGAKHPATTSKQALQDGRYRVTLYLDRILADYPLLVSQGSYADLNSPEAARVLCTLLFHELYHVCLRKGGRPAARGGFEDGCEEIAIDNASLERLCHVASEACSSYCQTNDPAHLAVKEQACFAHAMILQKWSAHDPSGSRWRRQLAKELCECRLDERTKDLVDPRPAGACASVIYPPLPSCPSGMDPKDCEPSKCHFPDSIPSAFSTCPICDEEGCDC